MNRAVDLLDLLAAHPTESFLMSELCRRVGINGASAHAVLGVLERAGYVDRHPRNRTYTLGVGAFVIGQASMRQHPAVTVAAPEIEALSTALDVEVIVAAQVGDSLVYLDSAGRPRSGAGFRVGQRVPCVPPYGTVHVAWSTEAEIADWLQRAPTPLTDAQRAEQLTVLTAIRRRGYAIGLDGGGAHVQLNELASELGRTPTRTDLRTAVNEVLDQLGRQTYQLLEIDPAERYDIGMVSAPVFDPQGRVAVSITLPGLPPGLTGRQILSYCDATVRTALAVTRQIEGTPPNNNYQPA